LLAAIVAALRMSSDATTIPIRHSPEDSRRGSLGRVFTRLRADTRAERLIGAVSLVSIVALSLLLVVITADRPSGLAPTTHTGFFPKWMAGPLGGLWPGLTSNGTTLRWLFTIALLVMYLAYVLVLSSAPSLSARWVIGAILAVHVVYLVAPPMALTDVFNYINYGRMEIVHHLNPYTTTPISEPHDDPAFALSNWHQLLSPYGPTFTLITFAVVPLGVAGSFWALKALFMLTSLAIIFLVWKCAVRLGRSPVRAIALVGLNPIVLVWGLGGVHNDFLMVLFLVLGYYLLLRDPDLLPLIGSSRADRADASPAADGGAPAVSAGGAGLLSRARGLLLPLSAVQLGAGAAFAVGTSIKASGGIVIPVVLAALLRRPRALVQVLIGMIVASMLLAAASLSAFGLHIPDLSTQSVLVTAESMPNLIGLAIGVGGESAGVRLFVEAALLSSLIAGCWYSWRRRDAITPAGWVNVALILTLSWVLPWYVLWILPLAAMSASRRLRVAAVLVGLFLVITWAPASGLLWSGIGFNPEKTPLGRTQERHIRELLH
jgi:hypothetical protein